MGHRTIIAPTTFHHWHQDGAAPWPLPGRFHKAFVMISKNLSTSRGHASAASTNLEAVSARARYAQNCAMTRDFNHDYGFERDRFKCSPALDPGDVLFFREDVWHKTQDALLDRLALIVDIYRVPLRTTPVPTGSVDWSAVMRTSLKG